MIKRFFYIAASTAFCLVHVASAQTISEKMASSASRQGESDVSIDTLIQDVNHRLVSLKSELNSGYAEARQLQENGASEEEYLELLQRVNGARTQMLQLE